MSIAANDLPVSTVVLKGIGRCFTQSFQVFSDRLTGGLNNTKFACTKQLCLDLSQDNSAIIHYWKPVKVGDSILYVPDPSYIRLRGNERDLDTSGNTKHLQPKDSREQLRNTICKSATESFMHASDTGILIHISSLSYGCLGSILIE